MYDNEKFISDNYHSIYGFSYTSTYQLLKRIESLNGCKNSYIVCDELTFIQQFNSHELFGIHKVIVDDERAERYKKMFYDGRNDCVVIVVVPETGTIYGVVYT